MVIKNNADPSGSVPVTKLQRPKEEGGWNFPNIRAKCRTLLYNRVHIMGERVGTVLSEQMRNWDLTHPLANPPNVARIPPKLVHIRQYAMDMAYVPPYTEDETRKTFKKRIYDVLIRMDEAKHCTPELRIVQKNPGIFWGRVWTNLHAAPVPDTVKSAWYVAIHDIVPTNNRLAAIRLTTTTSCARCGEPDSIQHTITECMEGRIIWTWTRAQLGGDTSYGSQTYTTRLADSTCLHVLAPAEAGGAIMDYRPSSILPLTVSQAPVSQGFYGFSETCQVEDVSPNRQKPQHWQVPRPIMKIHHDRG